MTTPINQTQAIVKKVYRAFFTPTKHESKPEDQAIVARGTNYRIPYLAGELAVTTWGDQNAPSVLLMHGWGGARTQMTGFVEPLLSAGFRAVTYDQPAHGESDGTTTSVLEIAPTMNLIAQREGQFDAILAHSFGTLITSYALVSLKLPPPKKLVYFGAFNRLLDSLPRFQTLANLPDVVIEGLRAMLYENFDPAVLSAIANETMAAQINIPALMFHDAADNVTPVDDSRAIAKAWKSAQYIETSGLGHRGALQSKEIQEQVVNFVKS